MDHSGRFTGECASVMQKKERSGVFIPHGDRNPLKFVDELVTGNPRMCLFKGRNRIDRLLFLAC
jgi:hypothetical protein